jgi:hypothetical protein
MQPDKVEMGETPFARKFLVLSKDPGSAKRIVNESIQAIFLENISNPHYNPTSVTIGPGGAVVLTGRTAEPERLQDLFRTRTKVGIDKEVTIGRILDSRRSGPKRSNVAVLFSAVTNV